DVAVFCQRGRKKKGHPRLEVYPKGFPGKSGKWPREREGVDGSGRPGRVRWKPAILAFLRARPETGAMRSDITDHCVGLIGGSTLVTAAPEHDRPWVNNITSKYLCAMKRAGEVVRAADKAYFVTARGLTWLDGHPTP